MSISDHGRSRLCCVCRWSNGFWSAIRPGIHIRAGEKVCIQAMTPTQAGAAVASRQTDRIASDSVTTGLGTIRTGISLSSRDRAISFAWAVTARRASSPYSAWLPVRNHASRSAKPFIGPPPAAVPGWPTRRGLFTTLAALCSCNAIECMHSCALSQYGLRRSSRWTTTRDGDLGLAAGSGTTRGAPRRVGTPGASRAGP